ncbi:hypothetical protein PENNAL_c0171G09942 [Penicillium nalgiovense]|uniref:Tc1-like transposase DDE domain-containing protein n=1 Tax=Penicillium nalgiovense TaxID=60175 RepID=A0A1V6WX33_PENNA|nr:hypothetical protein PENNAL_c0171G09942 [Penicillium nalgiovense]
MAPRLPLSKLEMIRNMILSKSLTASQMAKAAECSKRSIINISNNLRRFGNVRAPPTRVGRRRTVTPPMIEALCDHLLEKPGLYVDEMAIFLWDEFRVQVTNSASNGLLLRRTGWSPLGTAPLQVANFHRDQRYQILPAYCQDGILISRVFQGSTDAAVFEDFIDQLLRHCGRWPEPKSVLVMENASFHHSDRIEEMCIEAGVKLVYLPPYSPDLNPIEEFFSELKAYIRRNWVQYEEDPEQGFQTFLERCIEIVGSRKQSALGHFRHSGVVIDTNA